MANITGLENRIIFVVGVGRFGTSLLQSMLHAHPNIAFLPESHFFCRYVARPPVRWRLEREGVEVFRRVLARDKEFNRVGIPVDELLVPFFNDGRSLDLAEVYKRLLRLFCQPKQMSVIGDKDPRLVDYLDKVHHVFPEARILHMIRDPRDVLLSRRKADWSSGRPDLLHLLTYRAQLQRGRMRGGQLSRDLYMEVQYEDLLSAPVPTLQATAEHIGIDYDDAMLSSFGDSARELVDESEIAWKRETMGPLLKNNSGKWRRELSPWQVHLAEKICVSAFDELGYERANGSIQLSQARHVALRFLPLLGIAFEYLYAAACRYR